MKYTSFRKDMVFTVILLFISVVLAPSITAYNDSSFVNTIYVDDDNTKGPWDGTPEHPYQYIQDAIDNASGGEIVAVNPDGTERWRKMIANLWIDSSPCIGEDGTVYIGSSSDDAGYSYGYLHAFGAGGNNHPPNKPTITGLTSGEPGKEYSYTFSATDPDEDKIYYYIEWGDGTNSGWVGPYNSGEEITRTHTWSKKGTYTVRAKAKDYLDVESDWATLEVSMPKNKPYINTPFARFLENHPHMFPILRKIFD